MCLPGQDADLYHSPIFTRDKWKVLGLRRSFRSSRKRQAITNSINVCIFSMLKVASTTDRRNQKTGEGGQER